MGHSCALIQGDWAGAWSQSDCLDTRGYICKFALQVAPALAAPPIYPPPPGAAVAGLPPPSPPPPGFVYGTPTNYSLAFGTPLSIDGIHEFLFFNVPMTWDDAQTACLRNQAELAYIPTLAEWQAVVSHFQDVSELNLETLKHFRDGGEGVMPQIDRHVVMTLQEVLMTTSTAAMWIGLQAIGAGALSSGRFTWVTDGTLPTYSAWDPPGCPADAVPQPDNWGGDQVCDSGTVACCIGIL